jgi:hypothetical protein
MVHVSPPATEFYLCEWTPFWLSMDPRYKDIVAGLLAVPKLTGTTHQSITEIGDLLSRAGRLSSHPIPIPTGNAATAINDSETIRCADPWLEDMKGLARATVTDVLNKNPPSVAKVQEMRSSIAKVKGGQFRMVPVLFAGLRRGSNVTLFGVVGGGDGFVIKQSGSLFASRGSSYVLARGSSKFKAEILDWPDSYLMQVVNQLTDEGFKLIGTPMVILCPEVPFEWDDRVRWAEQFIDDGLGMYVVA